MGGSDLRLVCRFWFSVVGGFESRSGYAVFGFWFAGFVSAALVLLAPACVALRCSALPCVRFVCSGRDELIELPPVSETFPMRSIPHVAHCRVELAP